MSDQSTWRISRPTVVEKYYFRISAIVFALIVLIGFSGSIMVKTSEGFVLTPRIIIHGIFGILWTAIYVIQTQLISRGKVSTHRQAGKIGVAVFVFFLVATLYMLFTARSAYPELEPEMINREVGSRFIDLMKATALLIFAMANIRNPYIHKRGMFYLSFMVMAPAITRLPYLFGYRENLLTIVIVSALLILPLLIHDVIRYKWKFKLASLGIFLVLVFSGFLVPQGYWISEEWNAVVEKLDAFLSF